MNRLTDPGYIPERVLSHMTNEQIADIYKKLCLYENTGKTPAEIEAMIFLNEDIFNQLETRRKTDGAMLQEFENYVGLYDSIHILQNGGILDEEEVQVCEHNLLFQIIQMMHGSILKEGRTEA